MKSNARLVELFHAIDGKNAGRFGSFLLPACRFRFGNMPPVTGRAAVEEFVQDFFNSIASLSHTIVDHWEVPDGVVCHGIVSYTRLDGSVLTVPFANVMKADAQGISEYLIFADTSALYL